jgi:hypothetical protein
VGAAQLADFGAQARVWRSKNEPHSWVMFDFGSDALVVDGYSIDSGPSGPYMTAWVIETSSDGQAWTRIDSRSAVDFNSSEPQKSFKCPSPSRHFCRYVRLTQTGPNRKGAFSTADHFVLSLASIEFFGALIGPLAVAK